jgi:hypothetical protein
VISRSPISRPGRGKTTRTASPIGIVGLLLAVRR